jgi:hypothetical protein
LDQALPAPDHRYWAAKGPDYRAVLVPSEGCQHHMGRIASLLGITLLRVWDVNQGGEKPQWHCNVGLPDEESDWSLGYDRWHSWLPEERCALPEYIPDVQGGKSAPLALTDWKIRAIKLLILLERFGAVTRRDMRLLGISASRWTSAHHGFLDRATSGYVRCDRTPDLKARHPQNWAQIEADYDKWAPEILGELG